MHTLQWSETKIMRCVSNELELYPGKLLHSLPETCSRGGGSLHNHFNCSVSHCNFFSDLTMKHWPFLRAFHADHHFCHGQASFARKGYRTTQNETRAYLENASQTKCTIITLRHLYITLSGQVYVKLEHQYSASYKSPGSCLLSFRIKLVR